MTRRPFRRAPHFAPAVEPLEDRVTPVVTASFASGVLTINGDAANDTITVRTDNGSTVTAGVIQVVGVTVTGGTPPSPRPR